MPDTNLSFTDGITGWTVTNDQPAAVTWSLQKSGGVDEGPCLKVDITNRFATWALTREFPLSPASNVYFYGFWQKVSSPLLIGSVNPYIQYLDNKGRPIKPVSGETWIDPGPKKERPKWEHSKEFYLYSYSEERKGEWLRQVYMVPPVKNAHTARITLEVSGCPGTVYLDDFSFYSEPSKKQYAEFLQYAPFLNLGYEPQLAILRLQQEQSPFLAGADQFNRLMMAVSDAQERLELLERGFFYTGKKDTPQGKEFGKIRQQLADLYKLYGECFQSKDTKKLATKFVPRANALQNEVQSFQGQLVSALKSLCQERSVPWNEPEKLDAIRPVKKIPADGHMQQIVFGKHSADYHDKMEEMIGDFSQVRWIGIDIGKVKLANNGNRLDFSEAAENMKKSTAAVCLAPYPMETRGNAVMPAFVDKNWNDPEIYLQSRSFMPPKTKPGWWSENFNYFNPAVRESSREAARQVCEGLKGIPKIFIVNWENVGPYLSNHGVRSAGYGAVALNEFQSYLADKYKTIDALNKAHHSTYQSFADLRQPEDDLRQPWSGSPEPPKRVDPLRYEFVSWTHKVHNDYCKLIYQEIKKTDPETLVFSDYNYILLTVGFDPLMLFEACDMLNNHGGDLRSTLPQSAMFESLKRYHSKQLATFEDHWGRQDDWKRPGDETAKRLNIIRHMGRLASRGYWLQTWWYSYIRSAFIVSYGSANWADPAFDLTTFRYCATGLRTGIERVRRFEQQFLGTEKVRSRIVLIVPEVSSYHQWFEGKSHAQMRDLYDLLYGENYRFEYLTEKLVISGKADLGEYDICLIPYAPYFPKGLWQKLAPWIEQGGRLVCIGPSGLYDEFGFDDPNSLTAALIKNPFPDKELLTREPAWQWDNGKPIMSKDHGKGRVILASIPVGMLNKSEALRKEFLPIFETIERGAFSPDTPAEVTLRKDSKGNMFIFALNPFTDATLEGKIQAQGAYKQIKDLGVAGGFPVTPEKVVDGHTLFSFRLAPGQYTFFQMDK